MSYLLYTSPANLRVLWDAEERLLRDFAAGVPVLLRFRSSLLAILSGSIPLSTWREAVRKAAEYIANQGPDAPDGGQHAR